MIVPHVGMVATKAAADRQATRQQSRQLMEGNR